jgi:hypothetical protein
MINTDSLIDIGAIEALVKDKVAETIVSEVNQLLQNPEELLNVIQRDATALLVKQLASQCNNIDDIETRVAIHSDRILEKRIDSNMVRDMVYEHVKAPIEAEVNELLESNINISNIIEAQVVNMFSKRLSVKFDNIDIDTMVNDKVNTLFNSYISITRGISNTAKQTELTVMDDIVIVENELLVNRINSPGGITTDSNLHVKGNMTIEGDINTDAKGWDSLTNKIEKSVLSKFENQAIEQLGNAVLEYAKTDGIDFASITVNGKELVNESSLGKTVVSSNLQTLGQLNNLNVKGEAEVNDTLFVVNKRIGINTSEPSMALSVWDEEVSIVAGKLKEQNAYIGTASSQTLSIGINKRSEITILEDGLVSINRLRIGRNRLKYETDLPGYQGVKGDITFNTNVSKENLVFAWVCLGGHKWLPLKAVV